MDFSELLKHPLLLLLATALLSHYLIPSIARWWQDHQKEIELKTNFVSEISESVLSVVMSVQYAEVSVFSTPEWADRSKAESRIQEIQSALDASFRTWEIKRAVIGSKMRAYFSHTQIGRDWDRFSDMVTEVYALSGTHDPHYRIQRLNHLRAYFANDDIAWQRLENGWKISDVFDMAEEIHQYHRAWFSLKDTLLSRKDEIVQDILRSRMALFRRRSFFGKRFQRRKSRTIADPVQPARLHLKTRLEAASNPASTPAELRQQATALFNNNRYDEALKRLTRATEFDPDDARSWSMRGFVLRALKQEQDAVEALTKATQLEPENDHHWLVLGEALSALGRDEEALQAFTRATTLAPDYSPHWLAKGESLQKLGRIEEAREALARAEPQESLPEATAILIGVGNYPSPASSLNGPPNDVAALQNVLKERHPQWNVITLLNDQAAHSAIRHIVLSSAKSLPADSFLLVYLSGHGALGKNDLCYFLPYDYEVQGSEYHAIELRAFIEETMALHRKSLFIIDAPFNPNTLETMLLQEGAILTAGTRPERVFEGMWHGKYHGALTAAILESLSAAPLDQPVSVADLYAHASVMLQQQYKSSDTRLAGANVPAI
jgi:tetratricopeptide (TPR) repeat protein